MPSRYVGKYSQPKAKEPDRYAAIRDAYARDAPSKEPEISGADKAGNMGADFLRFVGDVAPAAGTALGGIAGGTVGTMGGLLAGGVPTAGVGAIPGGIAGGASGAAAGMGLGGAAGTALGALAKGGADMLTSGKDAEIAAYDDEESEKADRKQALLQALMSMRR